MKHISFVIACILVTLSQFGVSAQTNIKKAFDKLLADSKVTFTENHSLEKDLKTGVKESQCDIYRFTLPKNKLDLIKNIDRAFGQDAEKAYALKTGVRSKDDRRIVLSVGNGQGEGVDITKPIGCHYAYAAFLAPVSEDKTGKYRYAYGMNWIERDGKISGMLVVTYSTTLKYRHDNGIRSIYGKANKRKNGKTGKTVSSNSNIWFSEFMNYVSAFKMKGNEELREKLALKIYEHSKKMSVYPSVTQEDKKLAKETLQEMLNDKNNYTSMTLRLLNGTIENLR